MRTALAPFLRITLLAAIVSLAGCDRRDTTRSVSSADAVQASARAQTHTTPSLTGTWVARDVPTKLGAVKIELTLRENGGAKVVAWSQGPLVAELRNKEGEYHVAGQTLECQLLKTGSCQYQFDDAGHLLLQMPEGRTVQFERPDTASVPVVQ